MTLRTAYFHVKERKPDIQPNSGFMAQLMQLDKEIFGSESFNLEDYLVDVLMQMGFEEGAHIFPFLTYLFCVPRMENINANPLQELPGEPSKFPAVGLN